MKVTPYSFHDFGAPRQRSREPVLELEVAESPETADHGQSEPRRDAEIVPVRRDLPQPADHVAFARTVAVAEKLELSADSLRYQQISIVVELLPLVGAGHSSREMAAPVDGDAVRGTRHLASRVYEDAIRRPARSARASRGVFLNSAA